VAKRTTATVEAETPPGESEKAPNPTPATHNPRADHVPPQMTGKDVMANFHHLNRIIRQRRLEALARKHPEVAALLRSKVKTPTAESPRIES